MSAVSSLGVKEEIKNILDSGVIFKDVEQYLQRKFPHKRYGISRTGQPGVSAPIKRTRLNPVKTNHFVNFIARVNFLQDVAYGTKELKLDSGEKITIPNVIRTMVPSRIIRQYVSYCQETVFKPASERTLYRIIDVCAASKQKSLQGLHYFLTEGAQVFESLESVIIVLQEDGATSIWGKQV